MTLPVAISQHCEPQNRLPKSPATQKIHCDKLLIKVEAVKVSSEILKEVEAFHTLDEALRWGLAKTPPVQVATVIAQDEFSVDVVFRIDENIFLAFDTT